MNISGDWVTGFVEGVGTFTFCQQASGKPVPRFSVRMAGADDLLQALKAYFGVGRIYRYPSTSRTKKSVYYMVAKQTELAWIVKHFDQFPFVGQQKREIFQVWRVLVDQYRHSADKETLVDLAKRLSALQLRPQTTL